MSQTNGTFYSHLRTYAIHEPSGKRLQGHWLNYRIFPSVAIQEVSVMLPMWDLLTPWCGKFEKMTVTQLVKKKSCFLCETLALALTSYPLPLFTL